VEEQSSAVNLGIHNLEKHIQNLEKLGQNLEKLGQNLEKLIKNLKFGERIINRIFHVV
jgi:SMC interacting uncharacterized protein involved in chromosome segregation